MIKLATVQAPITADVHANGQHIRDAMITAAKAGARLIHFPECNLSGYVDYQVPDWASVDWSAIKTEMHEIAKLAAHLRLWVVLGANHRLPNRRGRPENAPSSTSIGIPRGPPGNRKGTTQERWPQNCLFIISDRGVIAGRYAKRLCSNTELTYWYTPGVDPLVFDVDGVRFGCALCIEVVFPHLFAEYERLGVTCLLLSTYSHDPIHGVMARAHAATNGYWLSLATPVACSRGMPTTLFGPDGHPVAECPAGQPAMILETIDPESDRYRVALRLARPWRARARSGELHAARAYKGHGRLTRTS